MKRLLLPALLVYSVILFRASHQSVTLDEADAYLGFSTGEPHFTYFPHSSNHVLNSLLSRHITALAGLSPLTFRSAALIGAALYLLAAAWIATRLAGVPANRPLQFLGFAVLTLNPFILDYLVAARGYALALGFLAAAVTLAWRMIEGKPSLLNSALLSICCGLSFSANFSFAFALGSTVAAFLLTLLVIRTPLTRWLMIAAATTLPAVAVAYAIVAEMLREFPRSQLYYGAETWAESWTEMLDAVFPTRNYSITAVNLEPLLTAARHAAPYLIWVPLAIALWAAFKSPAWPIRFVWLALIFTFAAHSLAHAVNNLLLPMDRTGLFIAFFLSILAVYAANSAPAWQARAAAASVLCAALAVFALAFHPTYFRIWTFDLDVDRGFLSLAQYTRDHPEAKIESVGSNWRYCGTYNFYNRAWNANIPKCDFIELDKPALESRSAYFLHAQGQSQFISKGTLDIIYQGPVSGLVVGVVRTNKNEPPE